MEHEETRDTLSISSVAALMVEADMTDWNRHDEGDALEILRSLPDGVFNTCVTSPPYWGLRDYGHDGQIGLEEKPEKYVDRLVSVFREVRRTLRDDGTLWLNLGDSYGHPKDKDLCGIPWRVAFALQSDGWYLRSDIIWSKPNPMPESVTDRPTKAHEYVFLMSKSARYYYDADAIKERSFTGSNAVNRAARVHATGGAITGGTSDIQTRSETKNKRSVWTVSTRPYAGAHFACYPPDLIKPCILAGSPEGGIVLDPFLGSGTTAQVAEALGRQWYGIELNFEYIDLIKERTAQIGLL